MDIDAFVAAHRDEWQRLSDLLRKARRPRRLTGDEIDELVGLYQRTATHLSVVQTRSPDPVLVGRLSTLVATAGSAVGGTPAPSWRDVSRFVTVTFPATAYRLARWWAPTMVVSLLTALAIGAWVATHPDVQRALLPPEAVRQLTAHDFADYYHASPSASFAAQVWTNNAWVSAAVLLLGLFLGIPTIVLLFNNIENLGVIGGYMVAAHRTGIFFGLVSPHGLLELTAVFVAAGTGLRIGWTVIDPGGRRRGDALAARGREAMVIAVGLAGVLAVSGAIEAFVTPSPLPTAARVGVGLVAEAAFLALVFVRGRRLVASGAADVAESGFLGARRPLAG